MYAYSAPRSLLRLLLVLALLAFSAPVYSSPDSVSAVPTDLGTVTANLRCLTFVNANVGYAAGASGVIIKTEDAGATWSLLRTGGAGDDYDLRSISFSDLNNGWAISLTGRVLRTQNGGADWSEVSSDLTPSVYGGERAYDLHFVDSSIGFAVGGADGTPPLVWKTSSAGAGDWYQTSVSPLTLGSYWRAGTNPGEESYPKDGLGYFYGLDFVPGTSTVAYAVGQDVFKIPYKSVIWRYEANTAAASGGWLQQTVLGTGKFLDVAFGTATNGVVVGDTGQIRYTKNAGTTWTAATSGLTGDIAAVDLDPTGRGWAVGASGRVIGTIDGGVTWTALPQLTGYYLEDIKWLGGDTLVAVGRGGEVIRSTDAGESWSRPLAPTLPSPPVMESLTSSSHPAGVWTAATLVNSAWTADGSNLTGYGYAIDEFADTVPGVQNTLTNSQSSSVADSGTYYVHVAAKDAYGQWSAPAHRQVLVDVTAPSIINDIPPAGYEGTALVTLTASDAHSGVDRIEHRVDGATPTITYANQASVSVGVGSHTLSYRVVDEAGNATSWTDVPVVVAPPAAPIMTTLTSSSHAIGVWTASTSVAAAWSASGASITGYGWVLDSSASTVPGTQNTTGTSLSTTVAGSGTYYVHVAAKDSYNQWSAPLHRQLLVDVTAPVVGTDATTGYQGAARVTITASDAHSGVNRVEYRIDGGTTQQVSATQAQVDFGVGDYTLSYRALDMVGNASAWTDINVSVALPDAPVMTSLTSSSHALGAWTSSTSVLAAWAAVGTDLAGYGWVLDSSANTVPGTQNTTGTSLSTSVAGSGTYYVHVAAKDSYNQWSAPLHRQLLVDVTAPAVGTDATTGYQGAARVTITASDAHSGVNRVEYRIDGGTVQQVLATQAQVDLGVGDYVLSYRALDNVGNASAWTDVNVSVAAPDAPVMTSLTSSSHALGAWTSSTSILAAWAAVGTDLAGYGWVLDSSAGTVPGVNNTSATSLSTTVAGSGTYYLHVAAVDDFGQWSTPYHRQLLVDVTAPSVANDAAGGYVHTAHVTLTASDAHSGVDRIEYRIDGGAVVPVYAGQAGIDLGVGSFVISYRAYDEVGNASGWTDVAVDVAPPAPPVMTSLTSSSHSSTTWTASESVAAAWTASGTDLAGYGRIIDSVAGTVPTIQNTTSTTWNTTVAGSGTYYLHVAAVDDFGQWSTPYHRQLLVDVTAPSVANDAASGYVYTAHVTLTASDAHSGVDRIEYRIDGGAVVPVYAGQAGIDLGVGSFVISYRAYDEVGNESGWTNVAVDVAPPAPPVMTSLTSSSHSSTTWTASTSVAAAWTASATDLAGYGRIIDSVAGTVPTVQNTTSTTWNTTAGGSGTYYLHVAAVDDYGQWSTTSHRQVLVDVTAPGVTDDVTTGYVSSARVTLNATDGHSGVDRIEYRIDLGTATEVSGNQAIVDFRVGKWTLSYRALDKVGNASGWTPVDVIVAPPAPPVMTGVTSTTHPAGQWVSSATLNAAWTAYGTEIVEYRWVLDNDAATQTLGQSTTNTTISTISTTVAGSGTYYLHVAARDAYDQWSTVWHQQILMDANTPTVSDDALLTTYTGTANVRITATDQHSGIDRIEYVVGGGSTQSVQDSQVLLSLHAGTHTIKYRAVDAAGNATGWTNRTVAVDPLMTPIFGTTRYITALEACEVVFPGIMPEGPDGHRTVIIASGANWPDALAAAGLAGAYKSPLLLTQPNLLPGIVGDQIQLLGADRAIIVGGTGAVSDLVFTQVVARVGGSTASVTRLSGTSRYATSNAIAAHTVSVTGRATWDGSALVSTGVNFPDALAAGPIATANGWPLYLAEQQGISPATISAMKAAGVQRVFILGGTGAVSEASHAALEKQGITVADRWDGADRYATGIEIANQSLARGLSVARPALATGVNFPDALAGGVMQGLDGSILMLTRPTELPLVVSSFVTAHASEIEELRVLGGTSAVSDAVRADVLALLAP